MEVIEVDINSIKVQNRFRKEFKDIDGLAVDIEKNGLIHPITVDEDFELITGERRYKAHLHLGRKTIKAVVRAGLNELQKRELELSENLERKDFTWLEEIEAKRQIHLLKQQLYGAAVKGHATGGWKLVDTAEALGESVGTVSMDLQLADAIEIYPELKQEANKTNAYKKLKKLVKRDLQKKLADAQLREGISHPSLILGDCVEEMRKINSETIHLIITDPPYGINLGESDRWSANQVNVYEDVPHEIENLLDLAVREMYRVLVPNSHLYLFFPTDKYTWTFNLLKRVGFDVYPFPIVWNKDRPSYPSKGTYPLMYYETIFFCRKGNRKLPECMANLYTIPRLESAQRIHPVERHLQLLRIFIESSSSVGETVLDPFAGSASTLVASIEMGRQAIGIEKDKSYYNLATERLNKLVEK